MKNVADFLKFKFNSKRDILYTGESFKMTRYSMNFIITLSEQYKIFRFFLKTNHDENFFHNEEEVRVKKLIKTPDILYLVVNFMGAKEVTTIEKEVK